MPSSAREGAALQRVQCSTANVGNVLSIIARVGGQRHCGQTGTADVPFKAHHRPGNGARGSTYRNEASGEPNVLSVCVVVSLSHIALRRKLATVKNAPAARAWRHSV